MVDTLCAICADPLTDINNSSEHIIPNSIGGRKKVKCFICIRCNSDSGDTWDAELAKQLNPISLLLCIKRDRGKPPPQVFETTGDEKLKLYPDGSMSTAKVKYKGVSLDEGKKLKLDITTRNQKELDQKLKELKNKYPKANFEELNIESNTTYFTDKVKIDVRFGGHIVGKSIVKSVMALAVESGVTSAQCELGLEYMGGNSENDCFSFFYEKDLVKNRPDDEILHVVSIKGCPNKKLLLGYVEYFDAWRIVVCLSRNYSGEKIQKTYAINPVTGDEFDIEVEIDLTINEVIGANVLDETLFIQALDKIKCISEKASYEREKKRAMDNAFFYAFENFNVKEIKEITADNVDELTSLVMEKLGPFLINSLK